MLARIRAWWRARSRAERFLFAVGVPVVAIAAVWGRLREGEDLEADRAEDAEGGEGAAGLTPGSPGASIVNAGAGGVDAGGFAQYLESFSSEISNIERRLDEFENDRPGFGDNPAEGSREQQIEACVAAVRGSAGADGALGDTGSAIIRNACEQAEGDPAKARRILEGARDGLIGPIRDRFPRPTPTPDPAPSRDGSSGSSALTERQRQLRDAPRTVTYNGVTYRRESGSLLYRSERSGAYLPRRERERVLAGV